MINENCKQFNMPDEEEWKNVTKEFKTILFIVCTCMKSNTLKFDNFRNTIIIKNGLKQLISCPPNYFSVQIISSNDKLLIVAVIES